MWQNSYNENNCLYIVPTPIGNMDDITSRALTILKMVDVIFAEDTRITRQLLNYFNISNKVIHLDDHNEENVKEEVINYLNDNKNVALVTDRGTPIISDPGYKTVRYLKEKGYNVVSLPGACAFVPALVASGINSEHFIFYGFLSSKEKKMLDELEHLKDNEYTMIFYEAPHRIVRTLSSMLKVFGDRTISISREISKIHESIFLGKISDAIKTITVKGEFVIVVEGCGNRLEYFDSELSDLECVDLYIKSGLSVMDAIKRVAKERNITKNVLYKEFVERGK